MNQRGGVEKEREGREKRARRGDGGKSRNGRGGGRRSGGKRKKRTYVDEGPDRVEDGEEIRDFATETGRHAEVLRFRVLLNGTQTLDIVLEHIQQMENEGLRENAVGIGTNICDRFLRSKEKTGRLPDP